MSVDLPCHFLKGLSLNWTWNYRSYSIIHLEPCSLKLIVQWNNIYWNLHQLSWSSVPYNWWNLQVLTGQMFYFKNKCQSNCGLIKKEANIIFMFVHFSMIYTLLSSICFIHYHLDNFVITRTTVVHKSCLAFCNL